MKAIVLTLLLFCLTYITKAQTITTIAGLPGGSYADGIAAVSAAIGFPGYIVFDDSGNYYFGSHLYKIRKVSVSGIISTIAGNGVFGYNGDNIIATTARIGLPGGLTKDKFGNIYIGDINNNRIRKVNKSTGLITTIAGNGIAGFTGDGGPASSAQLSQPWSLIMDNEDNLYFNDAGNFRTRKIDDFFCVVTVLKKYKYN